jgi:hypothetical protein
MRHRDRYPGSPHFLVRVLTVCLKAEGTHNDCCVCPPKKTKKKKKKLKKKNILPPIFFFFFLINFLFFFWRALRAVGRPEKKLFLCFFFFRCGHLRERERIVTPGQEKKKTKSYGGTGIRARDERITTANANHYTIPPDHKCIKVWSQFDPQIQKKQKQKQKILRSRELNPGLLRDRQEY